jgi:cytochrome c oxidase cbb3-type subunit 4
MDINDIRSVVTLVSFALFAALMVWTYLPRRRQALDEAAQLPFHEDDEGETR